MFNKNIKFYEIPQMNQKSKKTFRWILIIKYFFILYTILSKHKIKSDYALNYFYDRKSKMKKKLRLFKIILIKSNAF